METVPLTVLLDIIHIIHTVLLVHTHAAIVSTVILALIAQMGIFTKVFVSLHAHWDG